MTKKYNFKNYVPDAQRILGIAGGVIGSVFLVGAVKYGNPTSGIIGCPLLIAGAITYVTAQDNRHGGVKQENDLEGELRDS